VESAIFTSSPDLTAEYPARAARGLGWTDVPLLGAAEVAVPTGLKRCIRVLLHFYTAKPQQALETYLPAGSGEAASGPMTVKVTARGAERWKQGHPWIYRSDVADEPDKKPGIVPVTDRKGKFLGQALYSPSSEIRLRLLTRGNESHRCTVVDRAHRGSRESPQRNPGKCVARRACRR